MTCRELVELVTDYFEDRLAPDARAAFDDHLELCPGCVSYVEQLRTTIRLVHDAAELERRPEVAGLLAAFRNWEHGRASA